MLFQIKSLNHGINKFNFSTSAERLDMLDYEFGNFDFPINVDVTLDKRNDNEIVISGTVRTKVILECSLCAIEYEMPIDTDFILFYMRVGKEYEKEDLKYEDHQIFKFDDYQLNLTDRIRETLILEIPMKPLCKEDCKGLCFKCGQDLNEAQCDCTDDKRDPRWAALAELKEAI